jgi:MFS family permease
LIFFRAIQGLGASTLFVSSVSLISEIFKKEEQGRATSIYTGITGLGLAIGPVLGGFLVGSLGWRWVFWVNLPLIAAGYLCCAFSLRLAPHIKPQTQIDLKGLSLLIAGLGSLVYGIIEAANDTPFFWAFLLFGLFFLILFSLSEKKSKTPLIDLSLLKNRLILLCVLSVCAGYATVVYMFFDPLYLRTLRHLSAYEIGLMITAIPIGQVLISFFFNQLLKWINVEQFQLVAIGLALLSVVSHRFIQESTPLLLLLFPFFLLGINWGMINGGVILGVNHAVPPSKVGTAMGSVFTFWNITGSIFLAVSSAIFHLVEKQSFISAFHTMTTVNVCLSMLFFLTGLRVLKH